jgi:hypothetical protein
MVASIASEKGEKERAEDIESGDAGGDSANPEHPRGQFISGAKDGVFAEETGSEGEAGNGETGYSESDKRYRHGFSEATHVAEILFASEAVNNTAGSEEQESLEERVSHQVEDTG